MVGSISQAMDVFSEYDSQYREYEKEKAARAPLVKAREKAQQRTYDKKRDRSAASGREQPCGSANRQKYAAADAARQHRERARVYRDFIQAARARA